MTADQSGAMMEAKRRVRSLADRGKLLSPRDAWLLSGCTSDSQTLWSVSFAVALEWDVSAEDINRFLEAQFPQFNLRRKVLHLGRRSLPGLTPRSSLATHRVG